MKRPRPPRFLRRSGLQESELDDPSLLGIQLFELLKGAIEGQRVEGVDCRWISSGIRFVQRDVDRGTAVLVAKMAPCVVDEILRISCAAMAKKCPRFCQSTSRWPNSFK